MNVHEVKTGLEELHSIELERMNTGMREAWSQGDRESDLAESHAREAIENMRAIGQVLMLLNRDF